MATEKLETQVRQEQIAQATLDLVAADGVDKLSMAAVARRVGLVPSALYRHFKNKEELLDATLKLIEGRLMENARAATESADDAVEQLHDLLLRHVRLIRENRGIPQIIFSRSFYADGSARRVQLYTIIRSYLAQVADIIRSGQRSGQIGKEVDPEAASVLFLGLVQPPAMLWHMSNGDFDVTRQAKRAWPLFVKAIRNQAAIV